MAAPDQDQPTPGPTQKEDEPKVATPESANPMRGAADAASPQPGNQAPAVQAAADAEPQPAFAVYHRAKGGGNQWRLAQTYKTQDGAVHTVGRGLPEGMEASRIVGRDDGQPWNDTAYTNELDAFTHLGQIGVS